MPDTLAEPALQLTPTRPKPAVITIHGWASCTDGQQQTTATLWLESYCAPCGGKDPDCKRCGGRGIHLTPAGEEMLSFLARWR